MDKYSKAYSNANKHSLGAIRSYEVYRHLQEHTKRLSKKYIHKVAWHVSHLCGNGPSHLDLETAAKVMAQKPAHDRYNHV